MQLCIYDFFIGHRVNAAIDMNDIVILEAPYRSLLDWLHGDTIIGNMLIDGAEVAGDLFILSAIEGIVSAPAEPPARETATIIGELRSQWD